MKNTLDNIFKDQSKHSIAIILPFRDYGLKNNDRTSQLRYIVPFLENYMSIMCDNRVQKWKIFIVEQSFDGLKFNRGQLCNIGAKEAIKMGYNTLIFHDIDLVPDVLLKDWYINRPVKGIIYHTAKCWDTKYNFSKDTALGGIFSIRSDDFIKIDGFPNIYWGWGGEDDEVVKRILHNGMSIIGPIGKGLIKDLETDKTYLEKKQNYFDVFTKVKSSLKHEINKLHDFFRNKRKPIWWGYNNVKITYQEWWNVKYSKKCNNEWYNFTGIFNYDKIQCNVYQLDIIGRDQIIKIYHDNKPIHFTVKNTADYDFVINKDILRVLNKTTVVHASNSVVNQCLKNMYQNSPIKYLLTIEEGFHMYNLIRKNEYKNTLEIGLGEGIGSLWITQAHKDNNIGGVHVSIDPYQTSAYKDLGISLLKKCHLEKNFKFVQNYSYITLPLMLTKLVKYDMIYIDGNHLFDYTLIDFFYSNLLLKIGGIIILRDKKLVSTRRVADYIINNYRNYKYAEVINDFRDIILFVKIGEDNREWNYHRIF